MRDTESFLAAPDAPLPPARRTEPAADAPSAAPAAGHDEHDAHGLHAARGLIPAILAGAALWAAVVAAVIYFW